MNESAITFIKQPHKGDSRTREQITEHYLLERRLADRLRASTREERNKLYQEVYDELFSSLPHHPAHTNKLSAAAKEHNLHWQLGLLMPLLKRNTVFLEVGAGDCALSLALCEHSAFVYAADVSQVISRNAATPANFKLIVFDGLRLPLDAESVDLAYSNQVLEHIHPEDAILQLKDIYRILKPGGRFVCVTPNRIGGPWDVSEYFDRECRGFHLKEYTYREMRETFKRVGFRKVGAYIGGKGRYWRFPLFPILCLERVLGWLPWGLQSRLARTPVLRAFLGTRVVAVK